MYHQAPIKPTASDETKTECSIAQLQATIDKPVTTIVHGWHLKKNIVIYVWSNQFIDI